MSPGIVPEAIIWMVLSPWDEHCNDLYNYIEFTF